MQSTPSQPTDYGKRVDGTPKGLGFFGEIKRADDPKMISTELSATFEIAGKTVLMPLLVPTLSRDEINALVSGDKNATKEIYDKAFQHGIARIQAGKSPFADTGEQVPLPQTQEEAMQSAYNKSKR